VRTTGIYCRPVCPARLAHRKNVEYYPSAAAAEAAGYRPCLRCRPETAPFSPAWKGSRATVERAMRLVNDGALDDAGIDALAERLGIGARHLSRLFKKHVGASPTQVAQTARVQRAKRMVDNTDLPMTAIALAAGFGSLRRFNTVFAAVYGRPPTALRRTSHPPIASAA
jgi:AraC family transcriptional regulator of adaptative response/methylated-DNA-[protein]-cysteine methyltransferase